jgi:Rrf2 family protein
MRAWILQQSCVSVCDMAQNTRFAMSVHALCLLAEGDKTHTSQDIAESLKINPVVVRRTLAALQSAGIIASSKGPNGGSRLARSAKQISLADIYRATESSSLFHLPEAAMPEQRGTVAALGGVLKKAQSCFEDELEQISLSQLLKKASKKSEKSEKSAKK